jgi:hypothetical protein
MTQQLDMMSAELVDASVLDRIDAQLPKAREVKSPRLPQLFAMNLQTFANATGERCHVEHHESPTENLQ